MDGKLNKWNVTYTFIHHSWKKKKNASSLGSAFCSDILYFFWFSLRQHGLGCQSQMAFEFKHAYVRHLLWLSIFFLFFFFTTTLFFLELLLKLLCMVSNVLPSVSVWVCSIINTEGGERMNTWRECTVVPSPFLSCSPSVFFFFTRPVCLSLLVCVCSPLTPAFLLSVLQTPTYFCLSAPPPPHPAPSYHHHGTIL